jgi:hypothetical protein
MNSVFFPAPNQRDWKTLYRAAILEKDNSVIPERVSEAEMGVLARGRELCNEGTLEERESLEDALYALRAFRSAWEHTETA